MTSQSQGMRYGTKSNRNRAPMLLVLAGLWMTIGAPVATAESLYAIAEQLSTLNPENPQPILMVCNVAPDGTLTQQLKQPIPLYGAGAIGLALDSHRLFVSYMTSNVILIADATTLKSVGTVVIPGVIDLAGIAYDNDKGLLYCAEHGSSNLYVFQWKPDTDTLVPMPYSPVRLEGATLNGICLDVLDGLLYVGNGSMTVTSYSTTDWHLVGTITVARQATEVTVDPVRGLLYYGAGLLGNEYLSQYDMHTNAEKREVRITAEVGVVGLAVDPGTGVVFATTGSASCECGHNLFSYTSGLTRISALMDIGAVGNPGGVAVTAGSSLFNPLKLSKTVQNPSGGAPTDSNVPRVALGTPVTYNITFDPNNRTLHDVDVVDTLPAELTYVSALFDRSVPGQYDDATRTFKWHWDSLVPTGGLQCLTLTCLVDPNAPVGQLITNYATITTREIPTTSTKADIITVPLALQGRLSDGAVDKQDDKGRFPVKAGTPITYEFSFGSPFTAAALKNLTLVATLPSDVNFVKTGDKEDVGKYDPVNGKCTWSNITLAAGTQKTLHLTVLVNSREAVGAVFTCSAQLTTAQGGSSTAQVAVVVRAGSITPPPPKPEQIQIGAKDVYIKPDHIYRSAAGSSSLMIVVHMPAAESIGWRLIGSTPMVLTPGNVSATNQLAFGTDAQGKVLGFFDVAPILKATLGTANEYGECPVQITGQLTDGRTFVASSSIWILK